MLRIAGQQIALRDWEIDDLDRYAYWLRPEHAWQRLDGPYYTRPSTEEIDEMIDSRRDAIARGEVKSPRESLVICNNLTGRLVGRVNRYWISRETNWMALGLSIYDPADWRRGIGYEALGLWSDYIFEARPELRRLDLRTWSGNHGMMRLALKLGYREEARFRQARIVDGVYYDGLGYGVLREEWKDLYPNGFAHHLAERAGADHTND
jgi:RimJ/RimL family protein N-acetyltransferase